MTDFEITDAQWGVFLTQIEGYRFGFPFYFRCRDGEVELYISDTQLITPGELADFYITELHCQAFIKRDFWADQEEPDYIDRLRAFIVGCFLYLENDLQ